MELMRDIKSIRLHLWLYLTTEADKGEQITILDINHYIEGVNKLLTDVLYLALSHNPSLQELKKIKSAIKSPALLLNSTKSQHFPIVLKIHKHGIPFCPIVSNTEPISAS